MSGKLQKPRFWRYYRYRRLEALTQRVRKEDGIQQVSVVVATAVNGDGEREVLRIDVGTSEDGAFWPTFLRGLVARGLAGIGFVTLDAHQGLREAGAKVSAAPAVSAADSLLPVYLASSPAGPVRLQTSAALGEPTKTLRTRHLRA